MKKYNFDWKCTKAECGKRGSCLNENELYKVCPHCGSKVELTKIRWYMEAVK